MQRTSPVILHPSLHPTKLPIYSTITNSPPLLFRYILHSDANLLKSPSILRVVLRRLFHLDLIMTVVNSASGQHGDERGHRKLDV
jgi:hypothetical protein